MKNAILKGMLLALTIILAVACETEQKNSNEFTITGEIEGLSSNLFYRHPEREYSREYPNDTIFVENGKFTLSDTISELGFIRANTGFSKDNKLFKTTASGGYYPVKSMYVMFFAFPGAEVQISGRVTDFFDAYPSGDVYNNSLAAINKIAFPNFNESVNYLVESSYEKDSLKRIELSTKAETLGKAGEAERLAHIEANPNSLGALWYLEDMIMRSQVSNDKAIELFNNVSKELSEFTYYKNVETRINGIIATKEGNPVPEIKTNSTLDGKEFDIASLQGKYVLIDFWGIWCGPCVAEMPTVKEFQEKHKEKLVVLGINSGDTKEKIQDFVKKNGYNWPQLLSKKDNSSDNFVNRFNVQGFPTKLIIDPDGKILERYLGSGEEAFSLLEELLD